MEFTGENALVTSVDCQNGRAIVLRLTRGGADVAADPLRSRAPAEQTRGVFSALNRPLAALRASIGEIGGVHTLVDFAISHDPDRPERARWAAPAARLVIAEAVTFLHSEYAGTSRRQLLIANGGSSLPVILAITNALLPADGPIDGSQTQLAPD
jgi:NAD(P)-dependent dehydrogenase (short-subunit alcohol dehydrogenase family)